MAILVIRRKGSTIRLPSWIDNNIDSARMKIDDKPIHKVTLLFSFMRASRDDLK
jgi:hypothetical protein